jgi:hypothetical protein
LKRSSLLVQETLVVIRSPEMSWIREAACWAHGRRPFFAMADIEENARRKVAGKKEIPL